MNDFILKIKRRLLGGSYFREEKHISDPNADIYYVIRRVPYGDGFYSNYFYVLSHVVYAINKGWHPVVDMKNYKTLYHDNDVDYNLWERYYKPMDGVTLEQAYASKNYVLSSGRYLSESGVPVYEINQGHITEEMVRKLKPIVDRYICLDDEILNEIENFKVAAYWKEAGEIIGVHVRGTDMVVPREGHTLPPKIEKIEEKIDQYIHQNKNTRVFLCTDEEDVLEHFINKYGNKVLYTQEYRATSNQPIGIHKEKNINIREQHKYLLGKEIIIDAVLLSQCCHLICGISNVTNAAVLFNGMKYKNINVM